MDICLIKVNIPLSTVSKTCLADIICFMGTMPFFKGVGSGIQTSDKRILASNASAAERGKLHQMDVFWI